MTRITRTQSESELRPVKTPPRASRLLVIPDFSAAGRPAETADRNPLPHAATSASEPVVATVLRAERLRVESSEPAGPASPPVGGGTHLGRAERIKTAVVASGLPSMGRRAAGAWQRLATAQGRRIFVVGIGVLAVVYGLLQTFPSGGGDTDGDLLLSDGNSGVQTPANIQRMSQAPLRIGRSSASTESSSATAAENAADADAEIFEVRSLQRGSGSSPADPQAVAARRPREVFDLEGDRTPVRVAQRSNPDPLPDPARIQQAWTRDVPLRDDLNRQVTRDQRRAATPMVPERESIFAGSPTPSEAPLGDAGVGEPEPPRYRSTDPATYRDPLYEVPSIADRRRSPNR